MRSAQVMTGRKIRRRRSSRRGRVGHWTRVVIQGCVWYDPVIFFSTEVAR